MQILAMSTYPTDQPSHGGQHRAHNIAKGLRAAGHTVQVAGVLGSGGFPATPGFVAYPAAAPLTQASGESRQLEELCIGDLFARDDSYFNSLAALITPTPDLILVEQPWLMRFARRYADRHPHCKILYSSQNIEHEMKFDIIRLEQGVTAALAAQAKVVQCEVDAIRSADAIACVSVTDHEWISHHASVPCVLAPNGVAQRSSSQAGIQATKAISGAQPFALYCASAHPPNMNGFFDLMGPSIGALAPNQKIIIAGGAGPSILQDARSLHVGGLARLCIAAGTVDEVTLQGLLDTAHVIILPMSQGGGTNLKTAEALWSGQHIVATHKAMRGYEDFLQADGLSIADTSSQFLTALRLAMARPPHSLSAVERARRRVLLWDETLKPLVALVEQMSHSAPGTKFPAPVMSPTA